MEGLCIAGIIIVVLLVLYGVQKLESGTMSPPERDWRTEHVTQEYLGKIDFPSKEELKKFIISNKLSFYMPGSIAENIEGHDIGSGWKLLHGNGYSHTFSLQKNGHVAYVSVCDQTDSGDSYEDRRSSRIVGSAFVALNNCFAEAKCIADEGHHSFSNKVFSSPFKGRGLGYAWDITSIMETEEEEVEKRTWWGRKKKEIYSKTIITPAVYAMDICDYSVGWHSLMSDRRREFEHQGHTEEASPAVMGWMRRFIEKFEKEMKAGSYPAALFKRE